MPEPGPLMPLVQKYFEHDTVAAAHSLETMPESEAVEVLKALPAPLAARAIKHLQVSYAAALLKDAEPDLVAEILAQLEPSFAATAFMHLPEDSRERFLDHIPEKLRIQIREHLTYPEGSVGRLMSTDFLAFHKDLHVGEAIHKIRMLASRSPSSYAYVVDDEQRLVGVMNMRDLMLALPQQTLGEVMRTVVFSIHCFMDREEAANELSRRRYFAAPVVDSQQKILGIVKAEQLLQGIQEEVTEDLQRMFGAGADERVFSPLPFSLRKRLPWLHVNLATAFLAAAVVAVFEDLIAQITVLAVFLPVVAGQGGNAGAQSLAVVMRGMVMREIPRNKVGQLILKEGTVGAVTGIIVGVVTGLIAWAWQGNPYFGVVIALGMMVNLICAGLAGASIPVVMKSFGLDPAQCSSIILTTVTDVIGFLAFLGFALVFRSHLM